MPASSWWAPAVNAKGLSQGDLVADVLVGTPYIPTTFLGRDTRPMKGRTYWPQSPKLDPFRTDETGLYIARGRVSLALVVSHSCELDDKPDVGRVLVALVAPLSQVSDPTAQATILEQRHLALLPLPGVPKLGDHYADLRCIVYVNRKLVQDSQRICSMTDEGVLRLQAQLLAFFTRRDLPPA